jgi:hypothetical protein
MKNNEEHLVGVQKRFYRVKFLVPTRSYIWKKNSFWSKSK